MKLITIGLIVFLLLGVAFVFVTELYNENRTQQSEIDGLRKQNELNEKAHLRALDSIVKIQVLQADSTKYYRLLKVNDQKIVKTKTESHERIIFVNLNDSARHSKLAKFFNSYKHP